MMAYDIFHSYDFENTESSFTEIDTKSVVDSDGFMTDYTMYRDCETGEYVFVFGDKDIYRPEDGNFDWSCDTEQEAREWFDSYVGFEDYNDTDEVDDYLTESFDNLPDWIVLRVSKDNRLKAWLTKRGVDLKNATALRLPVGNITPSSLKDPRRIYFLNLYMPSWRGGVESKIYVPGFNNDDEIRVNDRYRKLGSIAASTLAAFCHDCYYIDLDDPSNSNTQVRRERANSKSKYQDRDLTKAQKPVRRNVVYGKKPDGFNDYDNVISYDIEWITDSGYDKSGYKLDPDKYIRLLNHVGLDNYAQRLDRMYNQIEEVRQRIAQLFTQLSTEDSFKLRSIGSFHNNIFGDIARCADDLSRVIYDYQRLKHSVGRIVNRDGKTEEEIETALQWSFDYEGRSVTKKLQEIRDDLKQIENAPQLEQEEE